MSENKNAAGANGEAYAAHRAAGLIKPEDSARHVRAQPAARKPMSNAEYVLSEIRLARAHASLWVNQLDTLGVALKAGLITPEMAVSELRGCGFFAPVVDKPAVAEIVK